MRRLGWLAIALTLSAALVAPGRAAAIDAEARSESRAPYVEVIVRVVTGERAGGAGELVGKAESSQLRLNAGPWLTAAWDRDGALREETDRGALRGTEPDADRLLRDMARCGLGLAWTLVRAALQLIGIGVSGC